MEDNKHDNECRKSSITTGQEVKVSIVVPMFNEEDNVDDFYSRVTDTLNDFDKSYEIIFIDDGSTDRTFELLKSLYDQDPAVRVIRFVRNFGQQIAMMAGLKNTRGDAVIMIDADLQVPPEEIPRMVDKLSEGYDIVYGIRTKRLESGIRRLGSWVMSHILFKVTGIDLPDSMSGFTALDRRFVDNLNMFNEKNKFFSGLFAWLSYGRRTAIPVKHAKRNKGQSKYSIRDLVKLTLRFVSSFTTTPLRFSFYIGTMILLLTTLGVCIWLFLCLVFHDSITHLDTVIILAAMGMFTSIQLITLGIVGEYIGNIYQEVKDQPPYVILEILERE